MDNIRSIVSTKYKLSNPTNPVTEEDDVDELATILFENIVHYKGVGLSANQIGINKSICAINVTEPIYLVNPKIIERRGKTPYIEACLSFPNEIVRTERAIKIIVECDNYDGVLEFGPDLDEDFDMDDYSILESVTVQHEIDHLNGVTMFDRVKKKKPISVNKIGRNDKVTIKNFRTDEVITSKYKYVKDKLESNNWEMIS